MAKKNLSIASYQTNDLRQREELFCTMKGKGFCLYENKDGSCQMLDDNCVNHTSIKVLVLPKAGRMTYES